MRKNDSEIHSKEAIFLNQFRRYFLEYYTSLYPDLTEAFSLILVVASSWLAPLRVKQNTDKEHSQDSYATEGVGSEGRDGVGRMEKEEGVLLEIPLEMPILRDGSRRGRG